MTTTNLLQRLRNLVPTPQVLIGRVVEHHDDDTSSIQLPSSNGELQYGLALYSGAVIRARGRGVAVGRNAFVRGGVVETEAPDIPPIDIVIGIETPYFCRYAIFSGIG